MLAPPTLVVSIVLDQVGSWVLEHHLARLPDDGLLKTMIRRGVWAHNVVYDYAGTYTGPGHAAIYTGASPSESGIVANRRYDRARARMIGVLDDGQSVELLTDGHTFVAPTSVRAETVADVLREAAPRRAGVTRIASLSMKDRGAVIAGGQRPDLVLWYTEEARGFTTSRYYAEALPGWAARFNAERPVQRYFTQPWAPTLAPEELASLGVADDDPGEGDWHGLGVTFPHVLSASARPYTAFLATPFASEQLLEMASLTASSLEMGRDAAPDLLLVSVSGTDYVGHVFGPESWEAADNLARVDAALGAMVRSLEARGPVSVLVTADHGAMPLVEHSQARGQQGAARIQFDAIVGAAEAALDAALGPGDWVAEFVQPYLYLKPEALTPARRAEALRVAREAVARVPGVGGVFRCDEAVGWRDDADRLRRAVARSVDPQVAGELFVMPADGAVVDERMPVNHGTSHGSPWDRDNHVPLLVMGPGIGRGEVTEALHFSTTAATLSAMLGVRPPRAATAPPLRFGD